MTYEDILEEARGCMTHCKACPVCDGRACRNVIPGPGAKGNMFIRNYEQWQKLSVNMDTICENIPADTSYDFFGHRMELPVFAGPLGALRLHYGEKYDELAYNSILIPACIDAGIMAFAGDSSNSQVMVDVTAALKEHCGLGVPTIKPWDQQTVRKKLELVAAADPIAVAMDIDAAGLAMLKNSAAPAGRKTVEQLRQIAETAGRPFILKGVMTVEGAKKAADAGAAGIVVSNHGGRVLDQCPSTAEALPAIADAVGGRMSVFVDGGIRTGSDIFKALALGADAVLIARPFVTMVYGAAEEGVRIYVEKLKTELQDTMEMCGANSLKEIRRSMLFGY